MQYVIPEFKGDHYFLSNFHHHWQSFQTADALIRFPTAEHVFQAAKYKYMAGTEKQKIAYVEKVRKAGTPTKARELGRNAKGLDIEAWDENKIPVMREILFMKFTGTELEPLLLSTGDAMLVEGNTWGDKFWGRCEGKGYNILGVLLMEIRGYLRFHNGSWPVGSEDAREVAETTT